MILRIKCIKFYVYKMKPETLKFVVVFCLVVCLFSFCLLLLLLLLSLLLLLFLSNFKLYLAGNNLLSFKWYSFLNYLASAAAIVNEKTLNMSVLLICGRKKFTYRKCSNYRPGRLFNFLRRDGGANSKGGAYFVYQFLASKWHYFYFQLTQTVTYKNSKNVLENYFLWNLKRSQDEAPMKVKHLRAHMDISIEEMRSKPVRLWTTLTMYYYECHIY